MRRALILLGLLVACGTNERHLPPRKPSCTLPVCANECSCDLTVACDHGCEACDPECDECRPSEAICTTPVDAGSIDTDAGVDGSSDAVAGDAISNDASDAGFIDTGTDSGTPDSGLREDLEPCGSDAECLSGDCHAILGRCMSRPDHPCELAVGCITPNGDRYGCDEHLQPPLCVEMTRLPGSLCFAPSDCVSDHCTNGICIATVGDNCVDGADCYSGVCYRGVCSCSPAEPQDCPATKICVASSSGPTPFSCELEGPHGRGEPCTVVTDDCQRPFICVYDGTEDSCREACSVATGVCSNRAESCWPIPFPTDIEPFFGVCVP